MNTLKIAISLTLLAVLTSLTSCGIFKRPQNSNTVAEEKVIEMVVRSARKYIGTPYKYGGRDRFGMDCSGLVCTAFQESGLTLPRTSEEQSKVGTPISLREIRPGDMVFFATQSGSNRISHAGIVTEVRSAESILFVHAANSGVKENNLNESYYKKTFVKATRPYRVLM